MRMLLAVTALALVAGPAATQTTPTGPAEAQPAQPEAQGQAKDAPKRACRTPENRYATVQPGAPPEARRLDQLPAGNLELAVQREVDGCIEPVIVRYDVAGTRR